MEVVGDIMWVAAAVSGVVVAAKKAWPVVKTLARAVLTLEQIAAEFQPNGGTSLRDKVDEIYTTQKAQAVQLAVIEQRLGIERVPHD